jgi:hypothetical protein
VAACAMSSSSVTTSSRAFLPRTNSPMSTRAISRPTSANVAADPAATESLRAVMWAMPNPTKPPSAHAAYPTS